MTWPDVDRYLKEHPRDASVVIPIGPVEEHGPHMTLHADIVTAERVAGMVAAQHHTLVFPAIPLMVCGISKPVNGTYAIKPDTLRAVARDLVEELVRKGFKRILFFTGHGGYSMKLVREAIAEVQKDLLTHFRGDIRNFEEASRVQEEIVKTPGDMHAGEAETSRLMHLAPEHLRVPFPPADFHKDGVLSASGICGNPQLASCEKGEMIAKDTVNHLLEWLEAA
jgi:creatinine amidohydrolase